MLASLNSATLARGDEVVAHCEGETLEQQLQALGLDGGRDEDRQQGAEGDEPARQQGRPDRTSESEVEVLAALVGESFRDLLGFQVLAVCTRGSWLIEQPRSTGRQRRRR